MSLDSVCVSLDSSKQGGNHGISRIHIYKLVTKERGRFKAEIPANNTFHEESD